MANKSSWRDHIKNVNKEELEVENVINLVEVENNNVKKIKINAEDEENKIDQNLPESIPKFRATCYRSGQNCHPFGYFIIQILIKFL